MDEHIKKRYKDMLSLWPVILVVVIVIIILSELGYTDGPSFSDMLFGK